MGNKTFAFYVQHILDSKLTDKELMKFTVSHKEGQNLVKYLQYYSETDEENNCMRTYIVRSSVSNEIVAYFSLKASMVSINEIKGDNRDHFDTKPAVELANFAVNSSYIDNHPKLKGCGYIVFTNYIMPIVNQVSSLIGVKYLCIFALPIDSLMTRYVDYGFKRLSKQSEEDLHKRLKPDYDEGCIFMYQEI